MHTRRHFYGYFLWFWCFSTLIFSADNNKILAVCSATTNYHFLSSSLPAYYRTTEKKPPTTAGEEREARIYDHGPSKWTASGCSEYL